MFSQSFGSYVAAMFCALVVSSSLLAAAVGPAEMVEQLQVAGNAVAYTSQVVA